MPSHPRAAVSLLALLAAAAAAACGDQPTGVVIPREPARAVAPTWRTYYIAADRVLWDYAPTDSNKVAGIPLAADPDAPVFTENHPGERIGHRYWKLLYREYTDAGFTTRRAPAPEWRHLGIMGPVVRGQVGDSLRVYFRNNTTRPLTFHVHGLLYDKSSEGAPYDDGDGFNPGDWVQPGAQHIYTFVVPARAGPGPADGSSILWMYHSHIDEPKDTNSGLVGPIIITAAGKATESGRPTDVEREFVMLFSIFNENDSWMLNRNIQEFTGLDTVTRATTVRKLTEDPEFEESNLMHAINGYVYGNLGFDPRYVPGQYPPTPAGPWPDVLQSVTMARGERVRWYLLGLGTEVDIHTPHWHGQTGLYAGMRTDVIELLPASMKVFDMVPDNPGTWLFHCHVNDHIVAGMLGRFRVE